MSSLKYEVLGLGVNQLLDTLVCIDVTQMDGPVDQWASASASGGVQICCQPSTCHRLGQPTGATIIVSDSIDTCKYDANNRLP